MVEAHLDRRSTKAIETSNEPLLPRPGIVHLPSDYFYGDESGRFIW
jgi:hypothetical protein